MKELKADPIALIDILRKEKGSYQELLKLAKREQELIISRDIEGLSDVIKSMERLMFSLRELEEKRYLLLSLNEPKDKDPLTPKLSSIISHFNSLQAKEAESLREDILSIVKNLDEINRTNAELLRRSIDYIDFMLDAIFVNDNPTYSNRCTCQSSTPRLFDGRA
ncbi:MAG: flagellar protein FlgN [Actinomycetota bacterium]